MGLTDAGAGIPEYWIVDLVHGRIEVFRGPTLGRELRRSMRCRM